MNSPDVLSYIDNMNGRYECRASASLMHINQLSANIQQMQDDLDKLRQELDTTNKLYSGYTARINFLNIMKREQEFPDYQEDILL